MARSVADVSAKIPHEMKKRLKMAAEAQLCSESTIVRNALSFYLPKVIRFERNAG
jgi:predicted DNA-binding protein